MRLKNKNSFFTKRVADAALFYMETTVSVILTIRLCIVATRREQKMSRVLLILFNMKMIRAILNERKVVHG